MKLMDSQRTFFTDAKAGAVNPVLPYFILAWVLLAMALWRIASTDPEWNKGKKPSPPAVARNAEPEIKELEIRPLAETSRPGEHVQDKARPAPADIREESSPSAPASAVAAPEPAKPVPSSPVRTVDSYLASHVGQQIPFLHKGQQRVVTLIAFTDDTVTIKTKKTLTLNRKDLSDEQLKLWK